MSNFFNRLLILSAFICVNFLSYSQVNNDIKSNDNEIHFNVVNDSVIMEESEYVDTLGYNVANDDSKYFDDIDKGCSNPFLYFDWMPGYNRYQNFDISVVHYKHTTSAPCDTLILGEYVHPACYKITSNYGKRRRRMHRGVDLGYPLGTPVLAAFDGIVRISTNNAGGYGNLIVIRHDNNLETYYAHLSERKVNPGQMISAGDTIGLGGNTGRSYGSHLHFETRYLGNAFNPNKIIDFVNFKLKSDTLFTNGFTINTKSAAVTNTDNPPKPVSSPVYYKVRSGDTLSHIAKRNRTTVTKIKQMNGLRSDFLRIGQRLRIR